MARDRAPAPRRLRRWLLTAVAVPVVALGCVLAGTGAGAGTPVAAAAAPGTTAVTVPTAPAGNDSSTAAAVDRSAVLAAVDAAATAAGGRLSVVVLDAAGQQLVTGEDTDQPEYTASLVKLLVVQQLLEQDEAGTITLDADDRALAERAVEASDDEAMDALWVRFDGARLVAAAAAQYGLTGTAPPDVAGQWGQSTTTAGDYATFLATLGEHLDAADLATLTGWMQATTDTAADGFDQDFGVRSAAAGVSDTVAAKQGWMCCVDSRRRSAPAGVLADGRVVVLLGDFPASTTWAQAQAALDTAAAALVSGT